MLFVQRRMDVSVPQIKQTETLTFQRLKRIHRSPETASLFYRTENCCIKKKTDLGAYMVIWRQET
jgi:hypothetical protein